MKRNRNVKVRGDAAHSNLISGSGNIIVQVTHNGDNPVQLPPELLTLIRPVSSPHTHAALIALDVLKRLHTLDTASICSEIIKPLLLQMGMGNVATHPSSQDCGVHITFSCNIPPDNQVKFNGVYVIKDPLLGHSRRDPVFLNIIRQATIALTKLRLAYASTEGTRLTRFIVVCIGNINTSTIRHVAEALDQFSVGASQCVDFWDVNKLTELINRHIAPERISEGILSQSLQEGYHLTTPPSHSDEISPRICRVQLQRELRDRIGTKYIPELYISRSIELAISHFIEDVPLKMSNLRSLQSRTTDELSKIRAAFGNLRGFSDALPGWSTVLSARESEDWAAIPRALREIAESLGPWERSLDDTLTSAKRRIQREPVATQANSVQAIEAAVSTVRSLHSAILDCAHCMRPAYVLIDRAGGGKTNLACHLAEHYIGRMPTLLVYGKFDINKWQSIESYIDHLLNDASDNASCRTFRDLEQYARSHGTALLVIIDAINENLAPTELSQCLSSFLKDIDQLRVKIIITCRDLYWTYFQGDWWTELSYRLGRNELYHFSEDEQQRAMKAYFDRYRILVTPSGNAREALRHPLMLRFFCEAFRPLGGALSYLGRITDVRRRELFALYCDRKFKEVARRMGHFDQYGVERAIHFLSQRIRKVGRREVAFDSIADAFGGVDSRSADSLYSRILDEDIIIEERPGGDTSEVVVSFVYDEFMEYLIATGIINDIRRGGQVDSTKAMSQIDALAADAATFISAVGILDYVVTMLFEDYSENYLNWMWAQGGLLAESAVRSLENILPARFDDKLILLAQSIASDPKKPKRAGAAIRILCRAATFHTSACSSLEYVYAINIKKSELVLKLLSETRVSTEWCRELIFGWLKRASNMLQIERLFTSALMLQPDQNRAGYIRQLNSALNGIQSRLGLRNPNTIEGIQRLRTRLLLLKNDGIQKSCARRAKKSSKAAE